MLQEIITYIIISLSALTAMLKIVSKLSKKREKSRPACNVDKPSFHKDCFDCPADCIFRKQIHSETDQNKPAK